nr:hypothetical protein [Candidatus Enterousia merdequi]
MKNAFLFSTIATIIPSIVFADGARITQLINEKQAKIAQLEKCTGSTKGLKIAGISTLGLTAVGVSANIAEASAIKKYDSQIESTQKKIDETAKEIEKKKEELRTQEQEEQIRLASEAQAQEQANKEAHILRNVAMQDINTIKNLGNNGDKAISHGYEPEQLPNNLRSQFATAMISFIDRCRGLIKKNGIEEVSLTPTYQQTWQNYATTNTLPEDYILPDLNEHIIAECKITKCSKETHTLKTQGGISTCVSNSGDNTEENTINENSVEKCDKNVLDAMNATLGTKKDTGCFVQKCKDGYHLELNGRKYAVDEFEGVDLNMKCVKDAVVKKATDWTQQEKQEKPDEFCNQAYSSQESKACCLEIYKNKKASSWNVSEKKCICNNGLEWKSNQCQTKIQKQPEPEQNPKDLGGKVITYSRVMSELTFTVNGTKYTAYSYDAKDAQGKKVNCGAGSEGYNKCSKIAIRQKLESLGYTNIGEIVAYSAPSSI